ncbi:MAG: signal peptide peptidase SppA [Ardenticatenia bacterium]|jgi:protease-4|nr:MAG: signal peptide peptidase SppA [Ardenticatenia bacterium]
MSAGKKILWMLIGVVLTLVLLCGLCVPLALFGSAFQSVSAPSPQVSGPGVALVRLEGVIISGDPPANPFVDASAAAYSGYIVKQLKWAEQNEAVKAVVLRIDSPGGSVVASNEIHQQVAAMNKPVVVSMGELAASGGYYVAAPADVIFANPDTLTGSIGVIAQFLDLSNLLAEYGVTATTIKSGKFKDSGSAFRSMTEEEKAAWQSIVDEAYEGFVKVVAEGRHLTIARVKALADGRVYTGRQAKELQLVDELGNLPDAIRKAGELGGITGEPEVIEYREPFDFFRQLLRMVQPSDPLTRLINALGHAQKPILQYLYVAP